MVGRDDNEVLNLYRGECKFSALHMSAFDAVDGSSTGKRVP